MAIGTACVLHSYSMILLHKHVCCLTEQAQTIKPHVLDHTPLAVGVKVTREIAELRGAPLHTHSGYEDKGVLLKGDITILSMVKTRKLCIALYTSIN